VVGRGPDQRQLDGGCQIWGAKIFEKKRGINREIHTWWRNWIEGEWKYEYLWGKYFGKFFARAFGSCWKGWKNTSRAVEEDWRDEVLKTMKHLGVGLLEVN
jgi:hypothetical protein